MSGKILAKGDGIYDIYERKSGAHKHITHYCPGCSHGVVHKIVAEAAEEMGILDKSIFISPVGCSVFGFYYMDMGNILVRLTLRISIHSAA